MCVSIAPARLTRTIGMVNLTLHPHGGEIVVVGYQNTAQSLVSGANAMILHFPAATGMSQKNFLDTRAAPHILEDMASAITPRSRGREISKSVSFGSQVQIFNHDIYTIVLTSDASLLESALASDLVPEDRRPRINSRLFNWYALEKPGHSFALCCFNNRDAKKASPFLVYYRPRFSGIMEFPGIDAHTGDVPDLNESVEVDHTIILSSYKMKGGTEVEYSDRIPGHLASFLPERVIGRTFTGQMPNGDFRFESSQIEEGKILPYRV